MGDVRIKNAGPGRLWFYKRFTEKIVIAQTCPDGTIIFRAGKGGDSRVPESRWSHNAKILDSVLESAFDHPLSQSYDACRNYVPYPSSVPFTRTG